MLSSSTEAFDRGDKFARYRTIESLTDYVLVSSERARVEHFTRRGELWDLAVVEKAELSLMLRISGAKSRWGRFTRRWSLIPRPDRASPG